MGGALRLDTAVSMETLVVGDVALEVADGYCLLLEADGIDTLALALLLLRTDTPTYGGERTSLTDDV